MALGGGRQFVGEERETRGYEPFAPHKHKHQAMLGVCGQEQGVIKSPCEQVVLNSVQWYRGGLVVEAHRLLF